jgi:hypothetical protein
MGIWDIYAKGLFHGERQLQRLLLATFHHFLPQLPFVLHTLLRRMDDSEQCQHSFTLGVAWLDHYHIYGGIVRKFQVQNCDDSFGYKGSILNHSLLGFPANILEVVLVLIHELGTPSLNQALLCGSVLDRTHGEHLGQHAALGTSDSLVATVVAHGRSYEL